MRKETKEVMQDRETYARPLMDNLLIPYGQMTQKQYFEQFEEWTRHLFKITSKKNLDYAGAQDAFKNFRQIEILSNGEISTEQGIFTRLSDKVSRIGTLLSKDNQVNDETILDTLDDLAVYAGILKIYLGSRK